MDAANQCIFIPPHFCSETNDFILICCEIWLAEFHIAVEQRLIAVHKEYNALFLGFNYVSFVGTYHIIWALAQDKSIYISVISLKKSIKCANRTGWIGYIRTRHNFHPSVFTLYT